MATVIVSALPSVQGTSELEPGLSALNAVVYFCQDKRHFHKSSAALSTHNMLIYYVMYLCQSPLCWPAASQPRRPQCRVQTLPRFAIAASVVAVRPSSSSLASNSPEVRGKKTALQTLGPGRQWSLPCLDISILELSTDLREVLLSPS